MEIQQEKCYSRIMIKTIVSDFSRVILFPKDTAYSGELNALHKDLTDQKDYKIFNYFYLNDELLSYYAKIKPRINIHIFTTGTIQNTPEILKKLSLIVDKIFTVREIGFQKNNPESYVILAIKLKIKPEEILFIDDTYENIKSASLAGYKVIHYKSASQTIQKITELFASKI